MGGGVWEQTRFVVGKIGIDSCGDKPLQDAFKAAALCSQDTMIPTHPPLNCVAGGVGEGDSYWVALRRCSGETLSGWKGYVVRCPYFLGLR